MRVAPVSDVDYLYSTHATHSPSISISTINASYTSCLFCISHGSKPIGNLFGNLLQVCDVAYRRDVLFRQDIKWQRFADGFPKIFIDNVKELAGRDGEDLIHIRKSRLHKTGVLCELYLYPESYLILILIVQYIYTFMVKFTDQIKFAQIIISDLIFITCS